MKKQGARKAVVATAAGLMSLLVGVHGAAAAQANFPRIARSFTSWLARAMDPCTPGGVSVVGGPTLPSGGCQQANVVTDNTLGMNFVKMRVTSRGFIGLFGTGFTLGDSLRVRLTLRVTTGSTHVKHPPGSNKKVTFADFTVDCPKSPDAFLVRPNGAVVGRTDLGACLATPNPGSALAGPNANIEILSASLINATTGQVVAVPGVLR